MDPGTISPWTFEMARMPRPGRRDGMYLPQLASPNQLLLPHRAVVYRKVEGLVKKQSATPWRAANKLEDELIKVAGQVFRSYRALVRSPRPAFGRSRETVDPWRQSVRAFSPAAAACQD